MAAARRRLSTVRTFVRRGFSISATVALVIAAGLVGAGTAVADPNQPQVFRYSGHSEFLCVPTGVDHVTIDAIGGAGGNYGTTGNGGLAARVSGTFPLAAQTELVITVGEWGHGRGGFGDGHGGKHGTAPGGALGNSGAGGGGSTAIKATSNLCGTHSTEGTYLAVAGGGGGAGGDSDPAAHGDQADGGNGGNAGRVGDDGTTTSCSDGLCGGDPGCGGQPPGGGCNDSIHGGDGTDIQTGMDGGGGGGGGGGGYNGGGKGHGSHLPFTTYGGGGAGGGASYADPGGSDVQFSNFEKGRHGGHLANGFAILTWGNSLNAEEPEPAVENPEPNQ
jgi:hypothetical protein